MHTRSGSIAVGAQGGRSPPQQSKSNPTQNTNVPRKYSKRDPKVEAPRSPRLHNTRHQSAKSANHDDQSAGSASIGSDGSSNQDSEDATDADSQNGTKFKEPAVKRPASVSTRTYYTRRSSPKMDTVHPSPATSPKGRPSARRPSAGHNQKPALTTQSAPKKLRRQSIAESVSESELAVDADDNEPSYPRKPHRRRLSSSHGMMTYSLPRTGIDQEEVAIVEDDEEGNADTSDEEIEREEEAALIDDFEFEEFDIFSDDDDESEVGIGDVPDSFPTFLDEDDLFTQDESLLRTPMQTPPPKRRNSTIKRHVEPVTSSSSSSSSSSDEDYLDPFFQETSQLSFLSTQPLYGGALADDKSDDDSSLLKYFLGGASSGGEDEDMDMDDEIMERPERTAEDAEERDGDETEEEDWESDIQPTPRVKMNRSNHSIHSQIPPELVYQSNHGPALGNWIADPRRPIYVITQRQPSALNVRRYSAMTPSNTSLDNSPITPARSNFDEDSSDELSSSLWHSRRGSCIDFETELFPNAGFARPVDFAQFIDMPDTDAEDTATVTDGMDDVTPSTPTAPSPRLDTLKTWEEVGVNAFRRRQMEHHKRGGSSSSRPSFGHRRNTSTSSLKRDTIMSPPTRRKSKIIKSSSPTKFSMLHGRKRSNTTNDGFWGTLKIENLLDH